ncbi:MAG TPA: lysozyme inhibitor LprI family protein [Pseudolabrys sp.]
MKFPGMLSALVVLVAASPAFSTPADQAADAKKIAQCLEKASNDGSFGGNCIGIVADPCIEPVKDKNDGPDLAKACATRELAVWNKRMQEALTLARKSGDAQQRATVAAAQSSWAQSRDKLCPLFSNLDPGMAFGAVPYCQLQETARRTLLLERFGAAISEH